MGYARRIVDSELDDLRSAVRAIALEGPKAVGKTATCLERAGTVHRLDVPEERAILQADPSRLLTGVPPILIDEWQRLPSSWDHVRRAVDEAPAGALRFLLTGSAVPEEGSVHSGAGRIVPVRMRPLSLFERGMVPTVRLRELLTGSRPDIEGRTTVSIGDYTEEIVSSGLPGIRHLRGRALRAQLDGYLARIVERDFDELGHSVRKPATLRRWLSAYAAATSTVSSWETIRSAATADEKEKPSRAATGPYREILERLWILDSVPGWIPSRNPVRRLAQPAKHHLADPALAARLLGATAESLLEGEPSRAPLPRDGTLLGALFESLVTLGVRVYAQASEANVFHLRTKGGRQEVDLLVERADHKVLAIEVKLSASITDHDVRHLHWLEAQLGDDLLDAVVLHTGREAYRRRDGVAVIPAALLGP